MKTITILTLVLLASWLTACSSVPQVTIPEEEYLGLQRKVRVLEREVADTKADYEAERGEQLRSREYLRKVEHPLTLKEEQERSGQSCSQKLSEKDAQLEEVTLRNLALEFVQKNPQEWEYYGSTYSPQEDKHFNLYIKKGE